MVHHVGKIPKVPYRICNGPKKAKTIFKDSLTYLVTKQGIEIIPIDPHIPLIEQHQSSLPFDAIVHKLYDDDWRKQLDEFSGKHPMLPIIDPIDNINRLHNRITMLEVVTNFTKNSNQQRGPI